MSKEKLSALMDGELSAHELQSVLDALHQHDSLFDDWCEWQQASSLMKGENILSHRFMRDFSLRLAEEPTVFAPQRIKRKKAMHRRIWVPMTIAASIAFVSVSMWRINYTEPLGETSKQYTAANVDENTANLQAYLRAHRESDGNPFAERQVMQANYQLSKAQ